MFRPLHTDLIYISVLWSLILSILWVALLAVKLGTFYISIARGYVREVVKSNTSGFPVLWRCGLCGKQPGGKNNSAPRFVSLKLPGPSARGVDETLVFVNSEC